MANPPAYRSRPPSEAPAPPGLNEPPPNEPPPSYADAIQSETAPLLAGPPPTYGTQERAYATSRTSDDSSIASSTHETSPRSLPEWVGQALVVLCFLGILYAFWRIIEDEGEEPGMAVRLKG